MSNDPKQVIINLAAILATDSKSLGLLSLQDVDALCRRRGLRIVGDVWQAESIERRRKVGDGNIGRRRRPQSPTPSIAPSPEDAWIAKASLGREPSLGVPA